MRIFNGKYFGVIVNAFLLIFLLGESYFVFKNNEKITDDYSLDALVAENEQNVEEDNNTQFKVEVKGNVQNPGVFIFDEGEIIDDAIKAAGGFKEDAYEQNLNLSARLEPQMVIYVYSKNEYKNIIDAKPYENCYVASYDISKCLEAGYSLIITDATKETNFSNSSSPKNKLVNINTADVSTLMTLSGIGEVKAGSIVLYRNEHGKFKNIADIQNVSGIGEAVYAKIKNSITI